jgi:hypothetical protein
MAASVGRRKGKPAGAGKDVKVVENESKSESGRPESPAPVEGGLAASPMANVGYRLTVKRTDPEVRRLVGEYGSVEVSVSLHLGCKPEDVEEAWKEIHDSVVAKVGAAFDHLAEGEAEDDGDA